MQAGESKKICSKLYFCNNKKAVELMGQLSMG